MRISLIVGLGNSDPPYTYTYHNVGFLAVDYLLRLPGDALAVSRNRIIKTEGAMNSAGVSVSRAVRETRVPVGELLVIHDDTDLTLGAHRYSFDRGSAGHRGVENVISALGTKAFWRLRIGVRPLGTREKAAALVLVPMDAHARGILTAVFAQVAEELLRQHHPPT